MKKLTVRSILPQVPHLEAWNIVSVSIGKKLNFDAKFIGLHGHVLLEGKPPMKFHKTFIDCDVFPRNVWLGKLLLQACYKRANFAEEIVLVFCGWVNKM